MKKETLANQAAAMGREDREAFICEYGEPSMVGEVGDWDAAGVGDAWRTLCDWEPTDPEYYEAFDAVRLAYLKALFDTEELS